jgi:predicted nucleic acid-binding protein
LHRIRVYADTSVFGGVLDVEFAEASKRFFDRVRGGEFVVLLSAETLRELAGSPKAVQRIWMELSPEHVEEAPLDAEVNELALEYVRSGVLGEASLSDAVHVAAATVAGADLILSWNFRHIVNFNRIRGFNAVNTRLGYRTMTILSPMEVGHDDEDHDS